MRTNQKILFSLLILQQLWNYSSQTGNESTASNNQTEYWRKIGSSLACKLTPDQRVFEVLPGMGWDNYRNVELSRVIALDFSQCLTSEDYNFLIPAKMNMLPLKSSSMDLKAEELETFSDYKSMSAATINAEASASVGPIEISGGAEIGFKKNKKGQAESKKSSYQATLRDRRFYITLQPDALLMPAFRNRLLRIAHVLTVDSGKALYADYLAEMIVRDFGTNYITAIEAGGVISSIKQDGQASSQEEVKNSFTMSASAKISGTEPLTETEIGKEVKVSKDSPLSGSNSSQASKSSINKVYILGGPPRGPEEPITDWQKFLNKNLVAIDRRGEYLHTLVTTGVFPELPPLIVYKVQQRLRGAILRYFAKNVIRGCMDFVSKHFDFNANVHDKSMCSVDASKVEVPKFGGIIQTCQGAPNECKRYTTQNIITGRLECPSGFRVTMLVNHTPWSICSSSECVHLQAIWCSGIEPYINPKSPVLFGGIYSEQDGKPNPLTHSFGCPSHFVAQSFGRGTICLNTDLESQEAIKSLVMGGIYTCNMPNVFRENEKGCPIGYSPVHAFTMNVKCEVKYCLQATEYANLVTVEVNSPPYTIVNKEEMDRYNRWKTDIVSVSKDSHYLKNGNGTWIQKRGTFEDVMRLHFWERESEKSLDNNDNMTSHVLDKRRVIPIPLEQDEV